MTNKINASIAIANQPANECAEKEGRLMASRRYITSMPIMGIICSMVYGRHTYSMVIRTRIVTMVPVLWREVNYRIYWLEYWSVIDRCRIGRLRIENWLLVTRLLSGRWLIASYVYYYLIARLAVYRDKQCMLSDGICIESYLIGASGEVVVITGRPAIRIYLV